jgi:hypothetical protein
MPRIKTPPGTDSGDGLPFDGKTATLVVGEQDACLQMRDGRRATYNDPIACNQALPLERGLRV